MRDGTLGGMVSNTSSLFRHDIDCSSQNLSPPVYARRSLRLDRKCLTFQLISAEVGDQCCCDAIAGGLPFGRQIRPHDDTGHVAVVREDQLSGRLLAERFDFAANWVDNERLHPPTAYKILRRLRLGAGKAGSYRSYQGSRQARHPSRIHLSVSPTGSREGCPC